MKCWQFLSWIALNMEFMSSSDFWFDCLKQWKFLFIYKKKNNKDTLKYTHLKFARVLYIVCALIWRHFSLLQRQYQAHINSDFHNCLLLNGFQFDAALWIFLRMIDIFVFHVLIAQIYFGPYKYSTVVFVSLSGNTVLGKSLANKVYNHIVLMNIRVKI